MTFKEYIDSTSYENLSMIYNEVAFIEPTTNKYFYLPLTEDVLNFLSIVYKDKNIKHIARATHYLHKGRIEFVFN